MAMMRPASRLAHVRDDRPQNVKRAVEVHVEHALEGGVVGVGDGLASGKAADQVGQDVDLSEAGDDRVGGFFRGVEAVERGGKRGEVGWLKSDCRIFGARPTTAKPASSKAWVTWIPRPPLAPVTRLFLRA